MTNFKSPLFEELQKYVTKDNYSPNTADLGRSLQKEGINETDLISYYHDALIKLQKSGYALNSVERIQRASDFLEDLMETIDLGKTDPKKHIMREQALEQKKDSKTSGKGVEKVFFKDEKYFQSLIEHAQDIITVLDHRGIIRYSSPSIERILGYSQGELTGTIAFQYLHENDVDQVKEIFKKLISVPGKALSEEFRFRHKEGNWVYLESIGKNLPHSPDGPMVIINSRNITERKKAVRKLEEHKIQLDEAQQIAKVGSWQWKPQKEVIWSDEMCRIYGYEPETFDNTYETFINHVHPDDRGVLEQRIEEALNEKSSFEVQNRIIRPDGEIRTLLCRGHVITDENDVVQKMIGTGQDVTEQKERERKLREYSNELRNLSEKIEQTREEERIRIARQVHDELGQMLTVLKMDVSMMKDEMKKRTNKKCFDYFNEEITEILDRINVIIKSVQRITTELRPEVLDDLGLKEAIYWEAKEFEKRTGINVNFSSNIEETDFLDDDKSTRLFRIFQETLTNIIRHANATNVWVRINRHKENLILAVEDDGVGISEEQKESSSSLGIIGMQERTQFLGGNVAVEGKENEGTTVTLTLPLTEEISNY